MEDYGVANSGAWYGLCRSFDYFQFITCFKHFFMKRRNFLSVELGSEIEKISKLSLCFIVDKHLSKLWDIFHFFQPGSHIFGFLFALQSCCHISLLWEISCESATLPLSIWRIFAVFPVKSLRSDFEG